MGKQHIARTRDTSKHGVNVILQAEDVPHGVWALSEVRRLIESEFKEPSRTREFSDDEMKVLQVSALCIEKTFAEIPGVLLREIQGRVKVHFPDRVVDVGVLHTRFEGAGYRMRKGVLEIAKQEIENSYLPEGWSLAPLLVVKFVAAESPVS